MTGWPKLELKPQRESKDRDVYRAMDRSTPVRNFQSEQACLDWIDEYDHWVKVLDSFFCLRPPTGEYP